MALRTMLVDDEQLCIDALHTALRPFPEVTVAGTASCGSEALSILRETPVDLVFLDIEMGDISGFELARHIQKTYPDIMIVFLTGHANFALEGYEYTPLDFLIKPVNPVRLERVLHRAIAQHDESDTLRETSVRIGLPVDGGMEIIEVDNLLYIEKLGRKVFLVCKNGERYQSYDTLQKLLSIFEPYGFFRCHQSFLVRVSAIRSIRLDTSKNSYNIQLTDTDTSIPLSRQKYPELKELLERRLLKICF